MVRILEINYWKVIPGAEQDLEDPVWKFAFALRISKLFLSSDLFTQVNILIMWLSSSYGRAKLDMKNGRVNLPTIRSFKSGLLSFKMAARNIKWLIPT